MARRNRNTANKTNGGLKHSSEKNNFQDQAEIKEYNKGYKAASRNRQGAKKRFGGGVYPIVTGSASNDANWYSVNNQIDRDSGSVTWPVFTGRPINLTYSKDYPQINHRLQTVQGIMVFDIFHNPGYAAYSQDAINQAAEALFIYITQSTGRTPQYDAPDIMLYMYAVASLYATYAHATRILGVAQDVSLQDSYRPNGVLYALQVNQDDLISNLANYRTQLNYLAINIAQVPMPQGLNFMTKMAHEMETVYMDAKNSKGQMYLFKPAGYWQLVEGDMTHPKTYLQYTAFANLSNQPAIMNFSDILGAITNMLAAIKQSGDFREMAADILKSFNSTISINPISETYKVTPVYDEAVLAQIENAFIYGVTMSQQVAELQTITQTDGINNTYLQTNYRFYPEILRSWLYPNIEAGALPGDLSAALYSQQFIFNVHSEKFKDPREVIHLTRYSGTGFNQMIVPQVESGLASAIYYKAVNNEAWDTITMGGLVTMDATGNYSRLNFSSLNFLPSASSGPVSSVLQMYAEFSQYDWHPAFQVMIQAGNVNGGNPIGTPVITERFQDLDIWTTIDADQMTRINTTAKLAAFIPRNLGVVSPF